MARAKKCDRCGKLYEHYDGSKVFKNTEKANAFILIDRDLEQEYWTRKSYDLCEDCMGALEAFLRNKHEDYGRLLEMIAFWNEHHKEDE